MNIPPALYGALGGALVTSVAWAVFSHQPATPPEGSAKPAPDAVPSPNRSTVTAIGDWTPQFPAGTRPSEVAPFSGSLAEKDLRPIGSLTRKSAAPDRPLTRQELLARAAQVEDQANRQLEQLAKRLDLTEDQQDRIFPILASASPAFHPSLQPEGMKGGRTEFAYRNGEPVYGDGTNVRVGAPIAEVENEIFPELDEKQQAILEEEAMDREAWWEDVVAFLEDDLEVLTDPSVTDPKIEDAPSTPAPTQGERDAAAEGNAVDNFADLLFGN